MFNWFKFKIAVSLNFTNICGAIMGLVSVRLSFWQGALIGALLILGRAGIDLGEKMTDAWSKKP